jgi:alkylhydroperoxidase family enzyme
MNHNESAARIDLTPPAGEEAMVAQIIAPFEQMLGRVPGGLQLLGISPPVLQHYAGTIGYYMAHSKLSATLLTFIRYLVSWRGDCDYCVDLNEAFLVNGGLDLDTVRATRDDPQRVPLEEREKTLLQLALDAVDHPESITAERIDALRAQGWSDRDMLDAVWHANLNRAFGRTAETFGLPPDGYMV